jgi:hypothetical protein
MNVGLPGTGLGGIFYFLCVTAMVAIELIKRLLNKVDNYKWRIASRQIYFIIGIIISMYAVDLYLSKILLQMHVFHSKNPNKMLIFNGKPLFYTSLVLFTLLIIINSLNFFIKKPKLELNVIPKPSEVSQTES